MIEIADPATGRFWARRSTDPMYARIILRSAEAEGGLESSTAKGVWIDEAGQPSFRVTAWEAIRRRVTLNLARVLLTTTIYNHDWLKTQVYDRWAAGHPDYEVIQFDSTENPAFPLEEFAEAEASMPKWRFQMQYRGRFERPAGLIYDSFDEDKHVKKRFEIPYDWQRFLGLDFGGVNTAGMFYAAEPGTRRLWAYREYKEGGRTAKEHAAALKWGEAKVPWTAGGAKSEGQWRDEFRAGGLVVAEPIVTEVEVGIDRVYGCHKRDEIFVFDDLAGYLAQKKSYSRKLDRSGLPLEDIENKASYHFCFIAGTKVETRDGPESIEDIREGAMALTRNGWRKVIAAGPSGTRAVYRVRFSNGSSLTGTGDHPIWIVGKGFVPIDALRYNDVVVPIGDNLCCQKHKSSTVFGTTVIQTPLAHPIAGISNDRVSTCTEPSGSTPTARFRPVTTSITSTMILATMTSATSKSLPPPITFQPIMLRSPRSEFSFSMSSSDLWQPNGTNRRRVESGTGTTSSRNVNQSIRKASNVSVAESLTTPANSAEAQSSARTHVGRKQDGSEAMTTWTQFASSAERPFDTTVMSPADSAPVHVQSVRSIGNDQVFNLTVEEDHEYYANGILVSNCDAERYIIQHLRRDAIGARPTVGGKTLPKIPA